jgi:uncharacterized membrane protein YpjA
MNWVETPRGLAIILCVVAVFSAVFGFWTGYQIAHTPQTISVHLDAPLVLQTSPPAK